MDLTQLEGREETEVPWLDEELTLLRETSVGGMDSEVTAGAAGGILAACVIGVLLAIGLLFTLAVFLDCRNKKQEPEATKIIRKKGKSGNFRARKESPCTDMDSIVTNMVESSREDPPQCSSTSVVVEVHR